IITNNYGYGITQYDPNLLTYYLFLLFLPTYATVGSAFAALSMSARRSRGLCSTESSTLVRNFCGSHPGPCDCRSLSRWAVFEEPRGIFFCYCLRLLSLPECVVARSVEPPSGHRAITQTEIQRQSWPA